MRKILIIFKLLIVAVLSVTSAGCISNAIQASDVTIDKNSRMGYVALSGMCEGAQTISLAYNTTNLMQVMIGYDGNGIVDIPCNTEDLRYFLLKLPAGNYNIVNFTSGGWVTKDFKNIPFKVLPEKVAYLGSFYARTMYKTNSYLHYTGRTFIPAERNDYMFQVVAIDRFKQDIPYLLHKYKNISKEYYVNQAVSIGNAKLANIAINNDREQDMKDVSRVPLTINHKMQSLPKMINTNNATWIMPK